MEEKKGRRARGGEYGEEGGAGGGEEVIGGRIHSLLSLSFYTCCLSFCVRLQSMKNGRIQTGL